ncbi:MAG: hypothetical protein SVS85_02455, partial [Candidatus Nanohaloarchaea archaeon]|nr:hypothetical protein [Candidatus Nanohaloarchaea archaeon]
MMVDATEDKIEKYSRKMRSLKKEIGKLIYGQEDNIEVIVKALACDGHVLLEGVPGTGKTLTVIGLSNTL